MQIAGSDPAEMAAAAAYNVAEGAQIIDINMGCPAKKVCRKAAGSALLADEPLVRDILDAVVRAVAVPVTLKIRTGPHPTHRNGVTIARIAEDAGIAALAVHGRTRACAFRGQAEYDTIAAIVAATRLPGIRQRRYRLARQGRGGDRPHRRRRRHDRPGRPGQALAVRPDCHPPGHRHHPAGASAGRTAGHPARHVLALHQFYGDFMGVRIARKHVGWYLQHRPDYLQRRSAFNGLEQAAEQLHYLDHLTESPSTELPQKELAA